MREQMSPDWRVGLTQISQRGRQPSVRSVRARHSERRRDDLGVHGSGPCCDVRSGGPLRRHHDPWTGSSGRDRARQRSSAAARRPLGVGYELIDLDACNRAGVIATITPDGVRRPVAMMALTFILALAQNLLIKDRITREGRWDERTRHMGKGLGGRDTRARGFRQHGPRPHQARPPVRDARDRVRSHGRSRRCHGARCRVDHAGRSAHPL